LDLTSQKELAMQSSTRFADVGFAEAAVDGNRNTSWFGGGCTHTARTTDPWWTVPLPDRYIISQVTIYNRLVSFFTRQIYTVVKMKYRGAFP